MNKKLIGAFICFLMCYTPNTTLGQQYCNTPDVIKDHFKTGSDIYIFDLRPGVCPRCEGPLKAVYNFIREYSEHVYFYSGEVREADYRDYISQSLKIESIKMLNKNDLDLHGIVKTSSSVPRVYKFNKEGILVYAQQLLGIEIGNTPFRKISESKEPVSECIAQPKGTLLQPSPVGQSWDTTILLEDNSSLIPLYYYIDGNRMVFNDQVKDSYHTYSLNGSPVKTYSIDKSNEDKYFFAETYLDSFYTKYMDDMSMVKVINLCPLFLSDSALLFTASFPKVTINIQGSDTGLDYYNKAVLVNYNFIRNHKEVISLNLVSKNTGLDSLFVPIHKEAFYYQKDDFLIMPVHKGWPAVGFEIPDNTDTERNPFLSGFYETAYGFLYSFNNGSIIYGGSIPELYKQHQLGYFAYSPIFSVNGRLMAVADKYTGEIQIYNYEYLRKGTGKNLLVKTIANTQLEQRIEKLSHEAFSDKMEYFNTYASQLNKQKNYLSCLSLTEDFLYTVVIYDSELFLEKYDVKTFTKIRKPLSIRLDDPNYYLSSLRINELNSTVWISVLHKSESSLSLLLKKIN